MTVVIAPVSEILGARWTLERSLPGVHALVGFPNVLVRELLVTELASVEVLPDVDVSVHPHVVAGRVVLSTLNANITLLTTGT